jgi:ABC-type transporter Mla subunit MlaD
VIVVVLAVLRYGRVGALHGDTTPLYMVTDMATGVIKGTEVWLGGQKVGVVTGVELRPPSTDTTERVLIAMDVLSEYVPYIHRDSDVQVRPGGKLIGTPVVFITIGTRRSPALHARDTLRALAQVESRSTLADLSTLSDTVTAMVATFGAIQQDFAAMRGRVADLGGRANRQTHDIQRALDEFTRRATRSQGSVALFLRDSARVRGEAARLAALTDSLHAAAFGGGGNVGRFRRDSSLVLYARRTLASVDTLRDRLRVYEGHPTPRDSALARELTRMHTQLDSLVQDAKHHPFRYLPL